MFRSPLARRLIIAIVLVSSAVTLCLTALQLYGEYHSQFRGIQAVFRQIEQVHRQSMSQSVWDASQRDLQLQLEGIVRVPNMDYAILREGDKVWGQAGRRISRNEIEHQYPITWIHRGQTLNIGTLTVVASLDAIYRELVNRALIIFASNAIKTFLVAGFAFAFFWWLVTRHLFFIAGYLRSVDLRERAPPLTLVRAAGRKPDELDEVAASINLMREHSHSLLAELQRKTELAQLLEQLARELNLAVTPEAAMEISLRRICEVGKWALARVVTFPPGLSSRKPDRSQWFCLEPGRFGAFMSYSDGYRFEGGAGVFIGRVLRDRCSVWLPDLTTIDITKLDRLALAVEAGLKSAFAFPVIVGGDVAAFLEFFVTETREPDALLMDGVNSLASQFARMIERSRASEAQARLAAIVDHSSDGIIGRTLDGAITSWNAGAERILGYTAAETIGRQMIEIEPPELRQDIAARRNGLMRGQAGMNSEKARITKDGRRIVLAIRGFAIKDDSGNIVGTAVILRDLSERIRADQSRHSYAARLQTVSRKLLEVQEDERKRLARELHDQVGQVLTALKINLQVIERQPHAAQLALKIAECAQIANEALQQVRTLMLDLRPPHLDELGLIVALRAHAERVVAPANLALRFSAPAVLPKLPPTIEIVVFRIVQEALTNILRHAGARNVWIELALDGDRLELTIRDNGNGFDLAEAHRRAISGGSIGLLSMEERAALADGRIEIRTAPGAGTMVRAMFLLTAAQATTDTA